jgi:hypothetical protein
MEDFNYKWILLFLMFWMRSHFRNSIIFSVICLIAAFIYGYSTGGWETAFSVFFIVLTLGALETSISFDNAIVNTTVLKKMDAKRRHRFLTRGILIAVVGMRIFFPLLIVSIFGHVNPVEALRLALRDSNQYALILADAHIPILGFGGAFLMMVGLKFFFDEKKHTHWISWIEKYLQKMHKMQAIEAAIVMILLYIFWQFVAPEYFTDFFVSGILGLIVFILVDGLSTLLESNQASGLIKSSMMWFLYLELLDASFSLDGVIGAFALSKNLFVIALWLGIWAYFVRSMTMYLYEKGTLNMYKYLENGAFWAICSLALLMFLGTIIHIPEVFTGLIGIVVIGFSIWSSVREKGKVDPTL